MAIVAAAACAALSAGYSGPGARATAAAVVSPGATHPRAPSRTRPPGPPYAVGLRVLTFVDRSRTIRLPDGVVRPRKLVTVIRYPIVGQATRVDVRGALPAPGRFPLIVFGHGFAVTPAPYARLLRSWAHAGYIVAAPVFPLTNANAPGGPDESDLIHQPRDMSFVITQILSAFSASIDPREIAVSGQSDGGETALAVAYDEHFVDRRVHAAVILSGAELPGGGFDFPTSSPPLLATQGTADTTNLPHFTYAFFAAASRPKYLLALLGAPHLLPYTTEQPQLGIVERVTIAFLDKYLKHSPGAEQRLTRAGNVNGLSALQADP